MRFRVYSALMIKLIRCLHHRARTEPVIQPDGVSPFVHSGLSPGLLQNVVAKDRFEIL